jgi:signal transduction histidine kinase
LSNTLVRVQEEERKRLSRELHDHVGQMLTALRIETRAMSDLRNSPGDEFGRHAGEALTLAEQALQTVRDMALGLRPSILDDLGLGPAIEWLVRGFSRRSNVVASVEIDGELQNLPDSHRTCMFRIAQEALTNILRHAKAKNVRLSLHGRSDRLILTVQDNGSGFNMKDVRRGLGLLGMEERAKELQGSFAVFSQPSKGALLQVELPLA